MSQSSKNSILVTGGAGYIGSHMVRMLIDNGYKVTILDNLSTGNRRAIHPKADFVLGDLRQPEDIRRVFSGRRFDVVIHFAASLIVPESVAEPLQYYGNNVGAPVNLLSVMMEKGVSRFIFSSTAATYGNPKRVPVLETDPAVPASPYGQSKLMVEKILKDLAVAQPSFRYVALRYFNVCGAHPSGDLGPMKKKDTLLIPNVLRAIRQGPKHPLHVFGDDYPTSDGTCIRDYVHVSDLCSAHLLALKYLKRGGKSDLFNLGNGKGFSVKQVVRAAERVLGVKVPVKISPRRPGDPARVFTSIAKARRVLGWKPVFNLERMIQTAWVWQKNQESLS